ncbi:Hadh [Symbiodinium natans]|uniref:Hadh protein n=1 Tax=Symbiodinium natans TaxID=878477 RepID=A0A812SLC2_9DINO|nr:Hadh [Symbiodinium natans]
MAQKKPPANIEEFLWYMHTLLVNAGGPLQLDKLKDEWLKFHGHKCNIERFLVVNEAGIGATLKRIPHVVKLVNESGTMFVKAAQPADIDQARLIEEDKTYRKQLAARNAEKAAAVGTSKAAPKPPPAAVAAPPAAPPAAPAAAAEGKRPAEGGEGNAEKKPRNEQEAAMLGRMLMQGVVRVLQNRAKNNQGALPLADLEGEFKELWKVPFNVKEAGETDVLSFLRKWPGKVELQKDNDSWKLALPKKPAGPTAAKSAPGAPPAETAPKASPDVPPPTPAPVPVAPPPPAAPKKGGPPSRPPTSIEDFLWNMHSLLHATEGPLELVNLRDQYHKHHGHKCNIERFLVVGEGGIGATLKRIPHVVDVYVESGTTYVKASQPGDIDRAQLIEEDKRYRREIASRNAAKAASMGTSKAAPPVKAAPAALGGEGKRPAEGGEANAEKKQRPETDPATLGRMLIQGVVRVLQNRAKASKGALPVSDLERDFQELWSVPFNFREAGEADPVSFLRKWPAKVEVFGDPGAWMVQLAKKPTAAKSAPPEAPAKATPAEPPPAVAGPGPQAVAHQDAPATPAPRPVAAEVADPALAQRLTELEQKANTTLEGMRVLLKQQEALVAELNKLKS